MIIYYNYSIMKCKYLLLLTIYDEGELWACDNQFNDSKTKYVSEIIKNDFQKDLNIRENLIINT